MADPATTLHWSPRPDWHEQAACRDHPEPDLWHCDRTGEPGRRINLRAKAVCRGCPVQAACLDAGLHQPHGIWGGLDPRERRLLRRTPTVHRPACGTDKGYQWHQRLNEHPCGPCRAAHNERTNRDRRRDG